MATEEQQRKTIKLRFNANMNERNALKQGMAVADIH